jgi:hypothetical protein
VKDSFRRVIHMSCGKLAARGRISPFRGCGTFKARVHLLHSFALARNGSGARRDRIDLARVILGIMPRLAVSPEHVIEVHKKYSPKKTSSEHNGVRYYISDPIPTRSRDQSPLRWESSWS